MTLKIRTWSLIAVSSALLPLIIFFIFALVHIGEKEQALIEAELNYRTSQIAQVTNERLTVSVQALYALGHSPSARNGDWPALYEHARRLVQSNPSYVAVTLTDATDKLLFVTSLPYGEKTFEANYPAFIREVFESGRPNVSGPFLVPIAKGYRVAVSVPILRGDKVTNVLRMILSTASIDELIRQQNLPADWLAAIADRDGTLIARSVSAITYVGKPASPSFRAAIQRKDGMVYKGTSLEGEAITSVVYPVFNGDWHASIAVPDRILHSQSHRTMLILFLMSLCAAAVGIGAAFVAAHFVAKQAKKLEDLVGSRTPAATFAIPPVGVSEFSDLYHGFCDIVESEQRIADYLDQVMSEKNEIRDLYERAPCGYHSLDSKGCIVRINQTELDWLGKTRDEVLGQPFTKFITEPGKILFGQMFPKFLADGHVEDVEFCLICSDGSTKAVVVNATLIYDASGRPAMSRSIVFDISERKKLEQRLEELSNKDSMTGLANRRHFNILAAREIDRGARLHSVFALAILDVDHFKRVNDEFGHAVGDRLLISLANILMANLRSIDIVARIGGEEFALLMPHTDLASARLLLDRLREDLAAATIPADDGRSVKFTVSIGVTIQQAGETDIAAMLARADKAMYEAKRLGRNRVCA